MNTHDIELPPLPEWLQEQDPDTKYPVSTIVTAMKQYAKVSIEADRQRRGEPEVFGHIFRVDDTSALIELNGDPHITDGMAVFAAPYPHDSEKTPSNDEVVKLANQWGIVSDGRGIKAHTNVMGFVRDVISSCRAPQPAAACGAPMSDKPACGAQNEDQAPQVAEPVRSTRPDGGIDADGFFVQLEAEKPAEPVVVDHSETRMDADVPAKYGSVSGKVVDHGSEPVKVPSDDDIIDAVKVYGMACTNGITTASELELRLHDIRALLARYTNQENSNG